MCPGERLEAPKPKGKARPFRLLQKYQVRLSAHDSTPHLTSPHLPCHPTQPIDGDASPRPRAHTAAHTYSYLQLLPSYSQQQYYPPSASGLKSAGRRGRASIQIIERERTPTSRTAPHPHRTGTAAKHQDQVRVLQSTSPEYSTASTTRITIQEPVTGTLHLRSLTPIDLEGSSSSASLSRPSSEAILSSLHILLSPLSSSRLVSLRLDTLHTSTKQPHSPVVRPRAATLYKYPPARLSSKGKRELPSRPPSVQSSPSPRLGTTARARPPTSHPDITSSPRLFPRAATDGFPSVLSAQTRPLAAPGLSRSIPSAPSSPEQRAPGQKKMANPNDTASGNNANGGSTSSGTGGFDLLKRATQAMMMSSSSNKPATAEDDGVDQIGLDTPRSGVATPQPDLHDKRLPGIMSYFNQSGPPTPTRALSSAQPSDDRAAPKRSSNEMGPPSGTQTPRAGVAQVPAAKGKLAIKIVEARGLRKSRDPYVVAVFQRNELISGPPQSYQEEDDVNMPVPGAGGVAIQRQGSDSGRPAVSIPMRSRQSSSTSITDHNNFRNRTSKQSFTNPAWDAEAIFDVIDSDMLINLSVYAHGSNGEEFLGHVDIQASMDAPIHGWYAISGHVDTMAENAPTGEIYVEAEYQRVERKHFGPEDFQILKLIGKGTFGQVYQVRKKDTGRIYAMKVLSKKVIVQKKEVAHTVGERNILVRTATTDSPFIVGLKFSFQTPSDLYLVTDYMSGGELFWHLQKEGRFDEKRAKFYIAELILAIEHLHRNDIVYRDLKPENILLDANGHIALCDFGLSKANLTKNDTTNTFCGTTEYLAPEVLLDESGYTKMVDFWSLGVLVFEMCCGWSPFYAEDTQQMYKNIAFGKVRFPRDTLSQEGRNFVKGLLNRNPKHRLGASLDAEELKRHAFFDDIDWEALGKKLITPPFKPKLKSATDVSYFDPEFTNALDNSGSLNERAAALARGFATSTPLSPSVQANFQGFTFVDESALDDHMKDRRGGYDDEEMNDARQDDDWDDLGDIAPRRGGDNRMSGIERTTTRDSKDDSHDDQMIGNSHFDL